MSLDNYIFLMTCCIRIGRQSPRSSEKGERCHCIDSCALRYPTTVYSVDFDRKYLEEEEPRAL